MIGLPSPMTLAVGTRVGSYEIVSALGAGGMGEVYRARDQRLGRDVAVKTLPAAFTNDPDRVARFEREARALAALNHPNIATIHGVEELVPSTGPERPVTALVMELVDGDTLEDRLRGGRMPLADALAIARQLAEALDAAHEKGIIHRDLKPANIKITPSGLVKVLDFGLAKAVGDDAVSRSGATVTMLANVTREGLIVGTPAYMSPEQVRGETVDKRTDVWAFGCVLYQTLTGSPAFEGATSGEIIAEVLKAEPDWSRLPAHTPDAVRRLLQRCLRKERSRRLRDIADARLEIEEPLSAPPSEPAGSIRRERAIWAGVTTVLVSALAILAMNRPLPDTPERRFEINLPARAGAFAISPDGSTIAFSLASEGQRRLWVRPVDGLTGTLLQGTEGARTAFWSPDGRSIGFSTETQIKRIGLEDRSVQTIVSGTFFMGGSWNRDTVLLYASAGAPIMRIGAAGGEPIAATRFEPNQRFQGDPNFLPDGQHFLFFVEGPPETRGVHLGRLGNVSSRRLFDAEDAAVFAPATGHLLFVRAGQLLAQAFDLDRLELGGNPLVIDDRVPAGTAVSASSSGTFVYREPQPDRGQRQLVWVDRKGQELQKVVYADTMALGPALSRDGRRVAVFRHTNGNADIWSYAVERRTWDRLTVHAGDEIYPLWSPDGAEIIFGSRRGSMDLYRKRLDAPLGSEQRLLSTPQPKFPTDWSRDGRFVLYNDLTAKGHTDLWALPLEGTPTPIEIVASDFNERHAQFSPDGEWIAYESDRTGRYEVYLRPFRGSGAEVTVSTSGGGQVRWSPTGRELFYIAADDTLMAVPVRTSSPVTVGTPQPLFRTIVGTTAPNTNRHQYMVSPDGESFVMNSVPEATAPSPLLVVVNWRPR